MSGVQVEVVIDDAGTPEHIAVMAGMGLDARIMSGTDDGLKVGKDCAKAAVSAKVLKNGKAKKITVFTYKPKKDEKRKMGHRQPYTKVEITSIKA